MNSLLRVAVNGYGVIGKRVADAVRLQDDMVLAGVADVTSDIGFRRQSSWRSRCSAPRSRPLPRCARPASAPPAHSTIC